MKNKLYSKVCFVLIIGFLNAANAQQHEKKFSENFKVDKEVAIGINAANASINVTTWSKNEVLVEAFITVEGLSKKDAAVYLENWNFEALGNKKKVNITAELHSKNHSKNNIMLFSKMDYSFPEIEIPDFNFDYDFDFDSFEQLEKSITEDGKYNFEYHKGAAHIIIKTKEEWELFKNSKRYEDLKNKFKSANKKIKIASEKTKEQFKKLDKQKLMAALQKAKLEFKSINIDKVKMQLAKAQKELMKLDFAYFPMNSKKELTINGKKIKIIKRIEIKVPKGATFNLNTRHCKVSLPSTVASGTVKYGSFDANNLIGGTLTVNYAPFTINNLNGCTLFLNNIKKAKIASITNTNLTSNYSNLIISKVNENTTINDKFGELTITRLNSKYKPFNLYLDSSEATLNLTGIANKITFEATEMFVPNNGFNSTKINVFKGTINAADKMKTFKIIGKHSQLTTIK